MRFCLISHRENLEKDSLIHSENTLFCSTVSLNRVNTTEASSLALVVRKQPQCSFHVTLLIFLAMVVRNGIFMYIRDNLMQNTRCWKPNGE